MIFLTFAYLFNETGMRGEFMLSKEYLYSKADEKTRRRLVGELFMQYNFLKKECIGESLCGRNIDAVSIGKGNQKILFCAAFHGMEWITTLVILRFVDELCNAAVSKRFFCGVRADTILKSRTLCVVPCVNPDGVEIAVNGAETAGEYRELVESIGDTEHWQANAGGVDLNHNFDAGWQELKQLETENGITSPSRTRYGGTKPESEPESRAIARFCRTNKFCRAFAFHTQGEEIYWSYNSYKSEQAAYMAELMAHSSGYRVSEPEGLAVGGGFKDWFEERFELPAFTIEMGLGKNPLPIEQLDDIYEKTKQMLLLAIII